MDQKILIVTHSVFSELGCKQVRSVKAKLQVRGIYSPSQLTASFPCAFKIPGSAPIND